MYRSSIIFAAVGFAVAVAVTPALAQDRPTGHYFGAGVGANIANDTETSGSSVGSTDLEHDTGHVEVLSFGKAFSNGFRAEFELGNRRNAVDQSGSTSTGGAASIKSAMINGFYDFATGTAFIPYIGGGIGAGHVSLSANPVGTTGIADSATGLALQGIAGVGYMFNESWMGTLEYRYFAVPEVSMTARDGSGVDADLSSHSIMLGLRYTFGAKKEEKVMPEPTPMPVAEKKLEPAPAPAPPPPPAVARNYIVFFDWDRATITPEAAAILRSAAENAKKGGISRIQATGHADRSGTQKYNLALSERRARAVQAELSKMGIGSDQVAVDWKGELEPLVQTDDGVREPQNRRVEIVFP